MLRTKNISSARVSFYSTQSSDIAKRRIERRYYFNFNEDDFLYARRNNAGKAAFSDETRMAIVPSAKYVRALDFVAQAWGDCKKYINERVLSKRITPSKFLIDLDPLQGYVSPHESHNALMKGVHSFLPPKMCSKNFADFADKTTEILFNKKGSSVMTKTSFIESNFWNITMSGLALEFSLEKKSNDYAKYDYYDDINFHFYLKALYKYGFRIDFNAPWRIVFDTTNPNAQKYLTREFALPAYTYDMAYIQGMYDYFYKINKSDRREMVTGIEALDPSHWERIYITLRVGEVGADERNIGLIARVAHNVSDPNRKLEVIDREISHLVK